MTDKNYPVEEKDDEVKLPCFVETSAIQHPRSVFPRKEIHCSPAHRHHVDDIDWICSLTSFARSARDTWAGSDCANPDKERG